MSTIKAIVARECPWGAPCFILHLVLMNSFKLFCVWLDYMSSLTECIDALVVRANLYSF